VSKWLKEEKWWKLGEHYVVVKKVAGTHCPELIQVEGSETLSGSMLEAPICAETVLNAKGEQEQCAQRFCKHTKQAVKKWLHTFLDA